MRRLILLTVLVLIVISTYSQNTYPQKIVYDKDTLVLITPVQLRGANKIFLERDMLDSLLSVKIYEVGSYKKLIRINDTLLSICEINREYYKGEMKEYKNRFDSEKTRSKKFKKQRNIAIGSGGGLLFLLILALL